MIPNLLTKVPVPDVVPEELEHKVAELKGGATRAVFLRRAFDWIVGRWGGSRSGLFTAFGRLFDTTLATILKTQGYMHCTTMNYLLRVMAVKSGLFKDGEIEHVLTHSWYIAPHQYLRVRLDDRTTIDLDPWNYQFGIDYGSHGRGFDSVRLNPIR